LIQKNNTTIPVVFLCKEGEEMIRGTTPTFTFNLPFEVSNVKAAYITIRSKRVEIEKNLASCVLNGTTITTTLTQEETLRLPRSKQAEIQLRVLTKDNSALATSIFTVQVEDILKEGVIE
jgi:hypothetical protein